MALAAPAPNPTLPARVPTPPTTGPVPKFRFFSRSRPSSPAPGHKKREPPGVLTLNPPTSQGRWDPPEYDGDVQEFHSHEPPLDGTTPLQGSAGSNSTTPGFTARIRTAPPTVLNQPSPPYSHTANPHQPPSSSHTHVHPYPHQQQQQQHYAHHHHLLLSTPQYLATSTNLPRPGEFQHPFSANYEPRSQESDRDYAASFGGLRRARDTNRRRLAPFPRDFIDIRTSPQYRAISLVARQRMYSSPEPHDSSGPPHGVLKDALDDAQEIDLDIYPWFIFQHPSGGDSEDDKRRSTDSQDYSFISL